MPAATSLVTFGAIVALALADGASSPTAFGAATVLVWLAVIASVLTRRDPPVFTHEQISITALLAALLGFTALSLSWGSDVGAGFLDVVRLAGYLGVLVLAGLHLRAGRGRGLLEAITLAALAIALVALGSRLGGFGAGDEALSDLIPTAAGRLSFPIGYWNGLGALVALAIPALVHLASVAEGRRVGAWLAAGAPLILTAYMAQSRGGLIAALIGAGVVIALAQDRRSPSLALAAMIASALPACLAAALASGIRDTPGDGVPGGPEALVAGLLLIGVFAAIALGGVIAADRGRPRPGARRINLRPRFVVPLLLAVIAGAILVGGPARLIDDFSALPADPRNTAATGILSASGSGRAQFWDTALEAFADEPARGIGAGGFATFWNRNGSLGTPVRDVHSEPLELLAELGVLGAAPFLAFFAVAFVSGARRARAPGGECASAALGVLAAGSVGFLIDFTWQIPAVTVPVLVVIVALTGTVFEAPRRHGLAPRRRVALPAPVLAVGLIALALASIWAGGVLAVADARLTESREALAAGDVSRAAGAARAAIAVEPWAAEPWLQLADIENSADNLEAARRAAREAIERSPEDFRTWLLISVIESEGGDLGAAGRYATRTAMLAPLVLQRLDEFVASGP